jgi:hypothetical protein
LTKKILGKNSSNEIDDPKIVFKLGIIKKARPNNYKPYTTTIMMQRKLFCAKIIYRAIKRHIAKKKTRVSEVNKMCGLASFDEEMFD